MTTSTGRLPVVTCMLYGQRTASGRSGYMRNGRNPAVAGRGRLRTGSARALKPATAVRCRRGGAGVSAEQGLGGGVSSAARNALLITTSNAPGTVPPVIQSVRAVKSRWFSGRFPARNAGRSARESGHLHVRGAKSAFCLIAPCHPG
ncbi:hypothetical protein KCP76_26205 (plasmid) [Salmonella enterica subsp. enterica serovar Weltevreden]|nr:hypothetical protein KCP76_26205 [Salmonella enterica subsp. enterica serovar Weltevreden]QUI99514.1 hypothetical protein KCP74_25630 [Salmonella enterica subsp. enterica]QUJ01285.1 hypothetical protein KCP73_26945 [Salmonella enterica subsp. enterica]